MAKKRSNTLRAESLVAGTPIRRGAERATKLLKLHSGLLIAMSIVFVFLSIFADKFATQRNLLELTRELSFVGGIAAGMALVIIAAEIDVSVGSAVGFGSALLGVLAGRHGVPLLLAIFVVLVVGTLIGLGAGAVTAKFGVPSFIVTLALFSALRGLALWITDAVPVLIRSDIFPRIGRGSWFGIPTPIYFLVASFSIVGFLASYTTFGRGIYAVGGNAEASRLSGIPVARVRIAVFGLTGFLAAVAAVLVTSQVGAGNGSIGLGVEFAAISAVIVGGASLYGGSGTIVGTLLGLVLLGMVSNGLILMGVDSQLQLVAEGAIVLAAVMLTSFRERKGRAA